MATGCWLIAPGLRHWAAAGFNLAGFVTPTILSNAAVVFGVPKKIFNPEPFYSVKKSLFWKMRGIFLDFIRSLSRFFGLPERANDAWGLLDLPRSPLRVPHSRERLAPLSSRPTI